MPPCEGGYKNFRIGDLFECRTGDVDLQQKDINGKGTYFINSGIQNYGIKGKTDKLARVFPANTITIDFWGNAFYRPFEYKLATHNHVFSLSGESIKNKLVGIYLACAMSYMKTLFSYNNMGTWSIIKDLSIHLPTTSRGDIDFAFMESRIRELEEERMRELEAYLAAAGFANCDLTPEEQGALRKFNDQQVNFKQYTIGDLFEIHPTKTYGLTNASLFSTKGSTPVVVNSSVNNGIGGKIDKPHTEKGNIITFSDTTTSDAIFYQPFDFVGYSHVQGLYEKNHTWIENELLYFLTNFKKNAEGRFDYATKFTRVIAKSMHISLPTTHDGKIDYAFMETYISAIKKQTIAALKDFIAREHTAYEQVINA